MKLTPGVSNRPKTQTAGSSGDFQTHPSALAPLLPAIRASRFTRIWEPMCGEGMMIEGLQEAGFDVIGTDILTGHDFFSYNLRSKLYDCIVTNPSYAGNLKYRVLERAYEIDKPFAFLMPLSTLATGKRQELFRGRLQIILSPKRPVFITPNGKEGGGWFDCAWLTWGFNLPRDICVYPGDFSATKKRS